MTSDTTTAAQLVALATQTPTAQARRIMALSLIDWASVAIAGLDTSVARAVRALALEEAGTPTALLVGGGRAPARAAALVNGTISHALDYDDTHFAHIGHPSVAVIPAALAMAERQGAGFAAFLDAALAGCEASVRFGLLFGRGHYQAGFHQTATAGAFGATLAAAQMLGADRAVRAQALGLVSTRAAGLKSQFGTDGKPYNAGQAAANGVEAALLAAHGMVSAPDALEGVNGFLATHHCDGTTDQPPGFLMPSVSHKFHACCHGLHATLDALATLPRTDPSRVQRVTVRTHPRWLTVCDLPAPRTGLELKFSYRGVVALHLLGHDTARLSAYDDALCSDPALAALRDKVVVVADRGLPETGAMVLLKTADGTQEAAADLEAPLSYEARAQRIGAKARSLLGPLAEPLIAAVEAQDMDGFCAVLGTPAPLAC